MSVQLWGVGFVIAGIIGWVFIPRRREVDVDVPLPAGDHWLSVYERLPLYDWSERGEL